MFIKNTTVFDMLSLWDKYAIVCENYPFGIVVSFVLIPLKSNIVRDD
jgi:hypothetical protein